MENSNPASNQKGRLDLRENYVMECIWYLTASIDTGMDSGLAMQILRCFGILAVYIVACLTILLPIRFLTKIPSFIFRKMLHIAAISGISMMILISESWDAATITSGLLSVVIYPILLIAERKPWFDTLFVQKSKGEIKRSMVLLFIMLTAVIAVAWGIFGEAELAAAAILMWGTGDAAAALVGIPFGKHKVHSRFTDGKKSWEGTIAMFAVSCAVGFLVLILTRETELWRVLVVSGICALSGAATELFSPSEYDTITVPVAITASLLLFSGIVL